MALLPEEQRTAIILKEYHGMTFQEIADLQGCPLEHGKNAALSGADGAEATAGTKRADPRGSGETSMTQNFQCGDQAALVGYLYDDCEPLEREAIAAHVISCPTCAEELAMLAATRRQLASWTPPDARLGFRITAAAADSNVVAMRPADDRGAPGAWWRQPLPAWAQLAAAAVIFAAGLGVGLSRGGATSTVTRQDPASVMRAELAGLNQRIAGLERTSQGTVVPVARVDRADILQRVYEQIAASERRQKEELAYRLVIAADTQQAQVSKQIENSETTVRNEMGNALTQVAQSGMFQPVSFQR